MRLNTFDDVKKWYDDIKPIISKNHTLADDVRPIGQRRYKWARIVKVDENTYALTDGSWSEMSFNGSHPNQADFVKHTAPILWERRPDGDYISIRGCMGTGYSISRYQFYNLWMPVGMYHVDNARQGKHWITLGGPNGESYILPKMGYRYDYAGKKIEKYKDNSLVFKQDGDKFVRVGSLQIKGSRIDKSRKSEVKPLMRKFYDWMSTIATIVPTDYAARSKFADIMVEQRVADNLWGAANGRDFDGAKVLEIMQDDEHECRVGLASVLLHIMEFRTNAPTHHGGQHIRVQDKDGSWSWKWNDGNEYTADETAAWYVKEAKRLKASYNRNMNRMLDLFAMETV